MSSGVNGDGGGSERGGRRREEGGRGVEMDVAGGVRTRTREAREISPQSQIFAETWGRGIAKLRLPNIVSETYPF